MHTRGVMVFETHFVSVALLFLTAASLATATTLYDLTFEHCNDTRSRAYQTHRGFEFEGLDVLNLFHSGQLHRVPLKLLWSAVEVTSNDKVVENSQLASLRALVLSSLFSNYAESNPPVLLSPFANASLGCSSKVCEISCSVVPGTFLSVRAVLAIPAAVFRVCARARRFQCV